MRQSAWLPAHVRARACARAAPRAPRASRAHARLASAMANVYEVLFDPQVVLRARPMLGAPVVEARAARSLLEVDGWRDGWVRLAAPVRGSEAWALIHHDEHGDLLKLVPPATFEVVFEGGSVAVRAAPSPSATVVGAKKRGDFLRVIGQTDGFVKLAGTRQGAAQYVMVKHPTLGRILEHKEGVAPYLQRPEAHGAGGPRDPRAGSASWEPPKGAACGDVCERDWVGADEMRVQVNRVRALRAHAELAEGRRKDRQAKRANDAMRALTGAAERSETGFYLGIDAL